MALPLKSGADLYNQQLIRAAVWNYSADGLDPSEYATGLMYFNTNPSSNMYQKLRFRTATDWKTIAFAEDLDVATNKDFKALKEKVELLSGEVDTDAIINNMKEVTAFLEGFAEDANLMSVLDGKLDKTGGTIQGSNEAGTADTPLIVKSANRIYTAISLQTPEKEAINLRWYNQYGVVLANSSASTWIVLGEDKSLYYTTDGAVTKHTLLHSGNVGEYKAGGLVTIDSRNQNFAPYANDFMKKALTSHFERALSVGYGATDYYMSILHISPWLNASGGPEHQLAFRADGAIGHRYGDTSWSDWKTIAFTEFTNAQELQWQDASGNAQNVLFLDGYNDLVLGKETSIAGYRTRIQGNSVELRYGTAQSTGLILNSSGNVTIGDYDYAGTSAKLWVEGTIVTPDDIIIDASKYTDVTYARGLAIKELGADLANICYVNLNGRYINIAHGAFNSLLGIRILENGNVGIGLTYPSAKLHVSQDIVANGTIACKGVAAEGSAPVGTVDKWAGSIATGTKSQTYTHGLGTTDITVAIYEKNGNEWVQILTDVDIVNANTIRVTFGANTTVEHRIVVMG